MKIVVSAFAIAFVALASGAIATPFTFNRPWMMNFGRPLPVPMERSERELEIKHMVMRVNNFDPQNFDTFKMAYYENDEFFTKDNGPIFIFVGGHWDIQTDFMLDGRVFEIAKEVQGSLFYTEHRYYGQSIPTENANTTNLRFLSVEQALADLASFIVQIKRNEARYTDSKVILVGGAYAASMVTWFRKQYPHLSVGSWASSAPIVAKVDFKEHKEIVGASIRSIGGSAYYDRINNGITAAEALIAENRTDRFNELFQVCDGFGDHPLDIPLIFSTISNIFAAYVEFHGNYQIQSICENLLKANIEETNDSKESHDLLQFAAFIRQYFEYGCHPSYTHVIATLSQPEMTNERSWIYQTCTEFGQYPTTESKYHPFGSSIPVDLYIQMCHDAFGPQFGKSATSEAIARTNVIFGGLNVDVSNVYFTNGLLDPWRAISIQEDLNESSPADVVPGYGRCMDLSPSSPYHTKEMQAVQQRVSSLMRHWLGLEEEL